MNASRSKESKMQRRSMSGRGSRAYFTATASKTHRDNVRPQPKRGGIRK